MREVVDHSRRRSVHDDVSARRRDTTDVPAHAPVDLEPLMLLVQTTVDDVGVDGFDDQVFQVTGGRDREGFKEEGVREDAGLGSERDDGEVLEFGLLGGVELGKRCVSVGEWVY